MYFINQQLAGFQLEVVKTNSAGHARKLAATVDFSSCPDGISVFTLYLVFVLFSSRTRYLTLTCLF